MITFIATIIWVTGYFIIMGLIFGYPGVFKNHQFKSFSHTYNLLRDKHNKGHYFVKWGIGLALISLFGWVWYIENIQALVWFAWGGMGALMLAGSATFENDKTVKLFHYLGSVVLIVCYMQGIYYLDGNIHAYLTCLVGICLIIIFHVKNYILWIEIWAIIVILWFIYPHINIIHYENIPIHINSVCIYFTK